MSSKGPTPDGPKNNKRIPSTLEKVYKLDELTDLITDFDHFDHFDDPATLLNVMMKFTNDGVNIVEMANNKRGRTLLFCNDRFVEMSGRTRQELMSARDLNAFTEPMAEKVTFSFIRNTKTKGLISRGFSKWIRPDGKENIHEFTCSCIGFDGDRVLVLGIDRDITDRQNLEDKLSQASKLETIGKLAGGISHDFNNQLTVIKGYCDLLLQGMDDEKKKNEALIEIRAAAERSAELTNQLLTFSRRQILTSRVINLNHTIEKLIGPLKRLIGETIDLEFIPSEDLDNVLIDQDRITQAIMNMAVNARDAMPAGGKLTIATENIEIDNYFLNSAKDLFNEPNIMLSISDNGIGMESAVVNRIFEPFFTTKDIGQGTGLGLSTVYGFIQQSGGRILVDSKLGEGTTFRIYLPKTDEPLEEKEDAQARAQTKQTIDLAGTETILIAEDEQEILYLMFRTLRGLGYNTVGSANPKAAVALGEHFEGKIDLLVSDIVMPGLTGIELAEKMLAKRPDMKVLFTTGYAPSEIREEMMNENTPILQKPFDAIELATKVRQILDQDKPAGNTDQQILPKLIPSRPGRS